MNDHLFNTRNSKEKNKKSRKNSKENKHNFGPSLGNIKQLEANKKVRKMIHYDCNDNLNNEGIDDDIPDEDEVYIKENLLITLRDKQIKEKEYHITE